MKKFIATAMLGIALMTAACHSNGSTVTNNSVTTSADGSTVTTNSTTTNNS